MNLSILCVTRAELRTLPFLEHFAQLAKTLDAELVFGAHGADARDLLSESAWPCIIKPVEGRFLEEMLEPAIEACTGQYILRLDDDERVPDNMVQWLLSDEHVSHDSWFFPRYHMWPDANTVITSHPFFPDFQQRLTTKWRAGRPPRLHSGSPWPAYRAPVNFEHHAFLAKSYAERQALTARYETLIQGRVFKPEEANVVAPEDWDVKTEPNSPSLQTRANHIAWWREVGQTLPPNLERELREWVNEKHSVHR